MEKDFNRLKREIKNFDQRYKAIIEKLKKRINELPDNPKINRLDKNCFTIKVSDLQNKWSAEYYDYKHQYKTLCNILEKCKVNTVIRTIEKIIETGQISNINGYQTYYFNPEVIEFLKEVI